MGASEGLRNLKQRATRIPRLPFSRETERSSHWTQSEAHWSNIEAVCNVSLSNEQRAKIVAIIDRYFREAPIIHNAPLSNSAIKRLRAIEKAALDFSNKIQESAKDGIVEVYLRSVMNEYLHVSRKLAEHGNDIEFDDLWRIAADAAFAAKCAADEITSEDHPRLSEKKAWKIMIADLWLFAGEAGISTTLNANKDALQSPFVRFVIALQNTFDGLPGWRPDNPDSMIEEIKKAKRAAEKARKNKTTEF